MKRLVRAGFTVAAVVYGIGLIWPGFIERAPPALQPLLLGLVIVGAVGEVVLLFSSRPWWRDDADEKDP